MLPFITRTIDLFLVRRSIINIFPHKYQEANCFEGNILEYTLSIFLGFPRYELIAAELCRTSFGNPSAIVFPSSRTWTLSQRRIITRRSWSMINIPHPSSVSSRIPLTTFNRSLDPSSFKPAAGSSNSNKFRAILRWGGITYYKPDTKYLCFINRGFWGVTVLSLSNE